MLNKTYIFGNWKMNFNYNDIEQFFSIYRKLLKKDKNLKKNELIVHGVAPTTIELLPTFSHAKECTNIIAQDVSQFKKGSYTGQIAISELQNYKIPYVIIGHSEERKYLGCDDKVVNAKLITILETNIKPIICIGEPLNVYKSKKTKTFLKQQLTIIFKNVDKQKLSNVIIAYEPLWAIGTGIIPTNKEIEEIIGFIKKTIVDIFKDKTIDFVPVLYGGSANEKNCKEILSVKNVNGLLIGGASLDPNKLYSIIKQTPQYIQKQTTK